MLTSPSSAEASGMSDRAVVEVDGIRKSFSGVEVLHGVDLIATGGSVLALLGENGAGKSTLMKILVGDYAPDSGRVTFDGRDITGATPLLAATIGIRMVFQELDRCAAPHRHGEHLPRSLAHPTWHGRLASEPERTPSQLSIVSGRTSIQTERSAPYALASVKSSRSPELCRVTLAV